jgi:hypothetical protein
MASRPEYASWRGALDRCQNKKNPAYPNYGGRGIKVCKRWRSFKNFIVDMGRRPTPKHTLDRIDVNGNYEPSNCRWATRTEQMRNIRASMYVEMAGVRINVLDVADNFNVDRILVRSRMVRGWSLEAAISTPARRRYNPKRQDVEDFRAWMKAKAAI